MYHTGAVIVLKMKLQNAADAAAMAGATVQARGMQEIAKRNKKIVDHVVEANEDVFGRHAPFPSDGAAKSYIEQEYLSRIQELVDQVEAIQREVPGLARDAAAAVGAKNLGGLKINWKAPRLRDPRLGDVLVKLKDRKKAEFHYVRKGPGDPLILHKKFDAPAYYDGKTRETVYSAVEARIDFKPGQQLGDTLFKSNLSSMSAYAAAKPYGGNIGGFDANLIPIAVIARLDTFPPLVTLWMRRWSGPQALFHDPLDYDVWLVRIGDPRLNPPPVDIPNHARYVH
jgi:hypothetical protein